MEKPNITKSWIKENNCGYIKSYDDEFYSPFLLKARNGDKHAIEKLFKWKNPSKHGNPMNLSRLKKQFLNDFLSKLKIYKQNNGQVILRNDFKYRAPVWSTFASHILYNTPVFDKYTYTAYEFFANDKILTKCQARIKTPHHWAKYDNYSMWFCSICNRLNLKNDEQKRELDQALFIFGKHLQNK